MTQVMGIQPTKESRAPEGRKKCEVRFFRPSGASLYLATNDPRLAPWAIFRRPLRGSLFIVCTIPRACAVGYNLSPLKGLQLWIKMSDGIDAMDLTGQRPTWAEINLDALAANFQTVRERVGPNVDVMVVIKADAYGHGAVSCARRLGRGERGRAVVARRVAGRSHRVETCGHRWAHPVSGRFLEWSGAGLLERAARPRCLLPGHDRGGLRGGAGGW